VSCREPETLCRGDILQPRYSWLIPLFTQLNSTKNTSKSSFFLWHIAGSKQCSASDRPSQRHGPRISGPRSPTCHYDVATSLTASGLPPELAIKIPLSSPKCPQQEQSKRRSSSLGPWRQVA